LGTILGLAAVLSACVLVPAPALAGGCPNEVFRESEEHGLLLPDCRAYEQVSPDGEGKNGNDAKDYPGTVGASPSGDSVHYFSTAPFKEAELLNGETTVTYVSSRGASGGWVTQSVEPKGAKFGGVLGFNDDLSQVLVEAAGAPLAADVSAKKATYYLRPLSGSESAYEPLVGTAGEQGPEASEFTLDGFSGDGTHLIFESAELLVTGAASGTDVANLYELDLEKSAGDQLSLVGVIPESGESCSGSACVVPAQGSYAGAGGELDKLNPNVAINGGFYTQSAISENGGLVFFTAFPSQQLYVRVAGASTFAASPGPARFLGATPNGEYVFYSEGGHLYDTYGGEPNEALGLYRYDTVTHKSEPITQEGDASGGSATGTGTIEPTSHEILDVKTDSPGEEFAAGESIEGAGIPEGDWIQEVDPRGVPNSLELADSIPGDSGEPPVEGVHLTASSPSGVLGVLGFSEDGSSVYFAAIGVLASNANASGEHAENRAGAGENAGNVYEWHKSASGAETVTFISQVADYPDYEQGGDEEDWTEKPHMTLFRQKVGRVTPDGSRLLFADGRQLYLYSAGVEGGVGSLVCVSCEPGGRPTAGEATLDGGTTGAGLIPREFGLLTRNLSENGKRVFFDTSSALLPEDTNEQPNVYEWEAEGEGSCHSHGQDEGCLYLISTGTSPEPSEFGDASANGNDLFFSTRQQLAATDEDDNVDVYDARVDAEGIEHPLCVKGTVYKPATQQCEVEPCYTAEECKEPPSEPPAKSFPATSVFTGPGNLTFSPPPPPPGSGPKHRTKLTRAQRLAAALKQCRKDKSAKKRVSCQKAARKKSGPLKKKKGGK
jgi:hypothetical protein